MPQLSNTRIDETLLIASYQVRVKGSTFNLTSGYQQVGLEIMTRNNQKSFLADGAHYTWNVMLFGTHWETLPTEPSESETETKEMVLSSKQKSS